MNGAIWFYDPQNIVLETKIIILCALDQKLCPKTYFCKMAVNIMHPYLANKQTAKDLGILLFMYTASVMFDYCCRELIKT